MTHRKQKHPVSLEEFFQYNALQRFWLKFCNKPKYKELKGYASSYPCMVGYNPPLSAVGGINGKDVCTFKHSGNAGDLIYALPTVRELAGMGGARLSLKLNVPMRAEGDMHPVGGVQLNQQMFDMLFPLLKRQEYIKEVIVNKGDFVDYDLDVFRDAPLKMDRLGICRWYFYIFGVSADLSKPWLTVKPDRGFEDRIVIARSRRYRNLTLNYTFLKKYPKPVFLGVESEFEDFRQQVPHAEWIRVKDFLQLAQIIAGSRLFIGNQSFPYSIAEAIKARRVLELNPSLPNVVPTGPDCHDVLFQAQFEHVIERMIN